MAYAAEISRANPSCFVFLIDHSGSMGDGWGGNPNTRKADSVATIVNKLLSNLVLKCAKDEGIRDYFDVGVLGYGARVGPALGGGLVSKSIVPISELADNPLRLEERRQKQDDGAGGIIEAPVKFPVWIEALAKGGTPMCQVLDRAADSVRTWTTSHPDSFPPIIFNITDGASTDGDPASHADRLRDLGTSDGKVLLFNIHVSDHRAAPISFPHAAEELPDQYARSLFAMSSELTEPMRARLASEGFSLSPGARGFVFNADAVSVINFLDIGTRPANLR